MEDNPEVPKAEIPVVKAEDLQPKPLVVEMDKEKPKSLAKEKVIAITPTPLEVLSEPPKREPVVPKKEEVVGKENVNGIIHYPLSSIPMCIVQWRDESDITNYVVGRLALHNETGQACIVFLGLVEETNPANFFSYVETNDNFTKIVELKDFVTRSNELHNSEIIKKMKIFSEVDGKTIVTMQEIDVVKHLRDVLPKDVSEKVEGELRDVIKEFSEVIAQKMEEEDDDDEDDEDYVDKETLKRRRKAEKQSENENQNENQNQKDKDLRQPRKKRKFGKKKKEKTETEMIMDFKKKLVSEKDEDKISALLDQFKGMNATTEQFYDTLIGKEVNLVRKKTKNRTVKKKSRILLDKWKAQVREDLTKK